MKIRLPFSTRGSITLEFAFGFMIFSVALLAVVEFSRLLFAWSTASEATRVAARLASICDMSSAQEAVIRDKTLYLVKSSGLFNLNGNSSWLLFTYYPLGCNSNTCQEVEVSTSGLQAKLNIPGPSLVTTLPDFRYRVTRETMKNTVQNDNNPACS